tara:strand:- start:551 stop:766 length:216 start_codon:yes stop_codon:yes gene_type:complete
MSEWKINQLNVSLTSKTAHLNLVKGNNETHVNVANLDYDQPGEQTETELQQMVLKAAKAEIQNLLDNFPSS